MKCKHLLLVLLTCIVGLASCNDDDDIPLYVGMGTVERLDQQYAIRFDSGEALTVADSTLLVYCGAQRPGQRVIASFQYLEGDRRPQSIYLVELLRVLTKDFFPEPSEAESDSLGNDPAAVDDVWIAGGHLNIQFRMPVTPYGGRTHYANVVRYNETDANGYVRLEFRHNQNGDGRQALATSYISLPLGDVADAPGLTLSYVDLSGNTRTWTLKKEEETAAQGLQTTGYTSLE